MTAATPLPCPSCGTPEPNLISYANGRYVAICRTHLCLRTAIMPTKGAAIARWNTRAPVFNSSAYILALADNLPNMPDLADRLRALAVDKRGEG